jgi:hypothetical protein
MIEFLAGLVSFLVLIFGEFFSARARAREEDRQYRVDQEEFKRLASQALTRLRQQAREDSGQAGPVEDQLDEELRRRREREGNQPPS